MNVSAMKRNRCLPRFGMSMLLAMTAFLSAQAVANQYDFPEDPESAVMVAIFSHKYCRDEFPSLKKDLDDSFQVYERENRSHFDDVRNASKFAEMYDAFQRYFADMDATEAQCRQLIDMFLSPASRIKPKNQ